MYGLMRAVVTHIDDPEGRGRIRASIPDMFADPETGEVVPSPWIEAKTGQGLGVGWLAIPPIGAVIWVQCVYSSEEVTYDLVYETGGPVLESKGSSGAPPTALGKDDESVLLKAGTPFTVPDPATSLRLVDVGSRAVKVNENRAKLDLALPSSANGGQYGKNKVIKTTSGFVFELDDTPGSARAQMHHPTGAGVEVNNEGVKTERWVKSWHEVADTATTRVGGDIRTRVDGHHLESIGKNKIEDIQGRLVLLAKEVQLQARLDLMFEASALQMKARGRSRFDHVGGLEVTVGDAYNLSATSVSMSSLGSLAIFSNLSANITGVAGVNLSTLPGLPQLRLSAAGVDVSPVGVGRSVALADAVIAALEFISTHTHAVAPPALPGAPQVAAPSAELVVGLPALLPAITAINLRAL